MVLPNVDSDLIAVSKEQALFAPLVGDIINPQTGALIDRVPFKKEWESPWMRYVPVGELTEMTKDTFHVSASQDKRSKMKGEHVIENPGGYPVTVERFSEIVCKTLDLTEIVKQYENNHILNTERYVVSAVYATRRVAGGFRVIAYLPVLLTFRSRLIGVPKRCHPPMNLDLMLHKDLNWTLAEKIETDKAIDNDRTRKRFSTVHLYGTPRHVLEWLQRRAGCQLEIFSWMRDTDIPTET